SRARPQQSQSHGVGSPHGQIPAAFQRRRTSRSPLAPHAPRLQILRLNLSLRILAFFCGCPTSVYEGGTEVEGSALRSGGNSPRRVGARLWALASIFPSSLFLLICSSLSVLPLC